MSSTFTKKAYYLIAYYVDLQQWSHLVIYSWEWEQSKQVVCCSGLDFKLVLQN